jgi:hypothetical protein
MSLRALAIVSVLLPGVFGYSSTASAAVISGVPEYLWYHGCAPTSAGMLVGYWDGRPGYGDLFYGDASVQTQAVSDMIASPQHLTDPYCRYHAANSVADFMRTDLAGYSDYADIGKGLQQYIEWDNPNTPMSA